MNQELKFIKAFIKLLLKHKKMHLLERTTLTPAEIGELCKPLKFRTGSQIQAALKLSRFLQEAK